MTRSLRELPPELYAAVMGLKTHTMAFAVLKTGYACPLTPENMKGKLCAQISVSHVARMLKVKGDGLPTLAAKGDRYLIEAKALFEEATEGAQVSLRRWVRRIRLRSGVR